MKTTQQIKNLQKFTEEEFQNNFESLFSRVENGEAFIITTKNGDVMICPYEIPEEYISLYKNHEEAP